MSPLWRLEVGVRGLQRGLRPPVIRRGESEAPKLGGGREQFRARPDEQLPAASKVLHTIALGEQAVVTNPLKTGRNDVEQKPAQELISQCHLPGALRMGRVVILVLEGHLLVLESGQSLVTESRRVASEIFDDLFGSTEGRLGIDHAFGLARWSRCDETRPGEMLFRDYLTRPGTSICSLSRD